MITEGDYFVTIITAACESSQREFIDLCLWWFLLNCIYSAYIGKWVNNFIHIFRIHLISIRFGSNWSENGDLNNFSVFVSIPILYKYVVHLAIGTICNFFEVNKWIFVQHFFLFGLLIIVLMKCLFSILNKLINKRV